jgi:hypothetical protein
VVTKRFPSVGGNNRLANVAKYWTAESDDSPVPKRCLENIGSKLHLVPANHHAAPIDPWLPIEVLALDGSRFFASIAMSVVTGS